MRLPMEPLLLLGQKAQCPSLTGVGAQKRRGEVRLVRVLLFGRIKACVFSARQFESQKRTLIWQTTC